MVDSIIMTYPYKKLEYENCIFKSKEQDGQPRGNQTSDSTFNDVNARLKIYSRFLEPVELALDEIPEEYRQGLINKIAFGQREPDYAADITWKRYRRRFRYYVAMYADLI